MGQTGPIGLIKQIKLESLIKGWFFFGLFFLPLVFWPWTTVPYEIPKVWFFQRWVEGLGVLGVLGVLGDKKDKGEQKDKRKNFSLVLLVLGFVLVTVVSSVLGVDFPKSVFGNYYRSDGLLTLFHLAGLFYFLVLFWERSWEKPTVLAIAAGSVGVSLWAIIVGVLGKWGVGIVGGSMFERAVGATFGNPNFLAGYLLVSLPFTILAAVGIRGTRRTRWTRWVLPLIQLLAIGLTLSRAAILGVFVLGAGYFWGRLGRLGKIGILGFFVILGILGTIVLKREMRVSEGMYFFPESRGRIVARGWLAFTRKPLFGWGWANFDYAFAAISWPMKAEQDVYVDKAHGSLLEILVTGGLAGLAVYMGIIITVFRGLLKDVRGKVKENFDWRKTIFLSFLLFLVHSQTNVISINEEMVFWLMAGIAGSGRL